jgi:hypothetical protein
MARKGYRSAKFDDPNGLADSRRGSPRSSRFKTQTDRPFVWTRPPSNWSLKRARRSRCGQGFPLASITSTRNGAANLFMMFAPLEAGRQIEDARRPIAGRAGRPGELSAKGASSRFDTV